MKTKNGKEKQSVRRMTREKLRELLEEAFRGRNLISRHDEVLNSFAAAGSLANEDCKGTGIEDRVVIGKTTFYPTVAAIDWLVSRVRE